MSVLDRLPRGTRVPGRMPPMPTQGPVLHTTPNGTPTGFAKKTIANPVGMPPEVVGASGRYAQVNPPMNLPAYTASPGIGSPLPQPQPALQIHPAWEYPPKGSQLFAAPNRALGPITGVLAAGIGSELVLPSLSYASPANYISVVRTLSVFINAPDGNNDISWILLVNGQSQINGFQTIFPFIAGAVVQNYSIVIRDIQPNSTITLLIQNNAASGPYTVGGGFQGWSYPQQSEQLLTGGLPT